MSRGPILTEAELERARKLYAMGMTWREVGEAMHRDHSGLRRRCDCSRSQSKAQTAGWKRRTVLNRIHLAGWAAE
jgi:hypothetical protein